MFSINYRDPRPIYEQVKISLIRAIMNGILKTDDKIPSVRDAARQLAINPNTIQKAYRELESDGYIYSVSGKGSFVSESAKAGEAHKQELFEKLDSAADELRHINVSDEEIIKHISENSSKEERQ